MHRLASTIALTLAAITVAAQAQEPAGTRLNAAFGGAAVDAVARMDYRLTVTDAQGRVVRDGRYRLLPGARQLYVRDELSPGHAQVWSGGDSSWRLTGRQWEFLGPQLAAPHRQHVAYHFLALLRDPATRYEALADDRLRLSPTGVDPFTVRLDPDNSVIVENRFDTGVVSRELDYRTFASVQWPLRYEVVESGEVTRRGVFSEVGISSDAAALPSMPMEPAERQLPAPQAGVARLVGAGWLSGAHNDYNLSLDARERLLVFARSEPGFEHAHIWVARRDGAQWTRPVQVPFSDPRYSDSDPWLTPDGRTLYFVSNRPLQGDTPRKDLDLWRVSVEDGRFGTPEHLASVSSDGQELGPELHEGWLYFNSSRTGGPAKLAIYRARVADDGFEAPQPLGAPFNDGAMQGDFTLSPDGRVALFWSTRDGSNEPDLFATRRIDNNGWSNAVRLPGPINATGLDFTPFFSADGDTLYLSSMRKPAWLDEGAHVFNGQSNVYGVPARMVTEALASVSP